MVGTTTRVSYGTDGSPFQLGLPTGESSLAISGNGRYVAFEARFPVQVIVQASVVTQFYDSVLVRDVVAETTTLASVNNDGQPGLGSSRNGSISADGRYIAFASDAANLVAGDTNSATDFFVRDRLAGTTTRISVDSNENQAVI